MKIFLLLLILVLPFCSCTVDKTGTPDQETRSLSNDSDSLKELTPGQEYAFEALNKLQVSTDHLNQFYSTFPNISQPCYPPDTTFMISQSELRSVLTVFVANHCTRLPQNDRTSLVRAAVLAQKNYLVNFCSNSPHPRSYKRGFPLNGTWVFPGVLGRRDIVIVW